MHAIPDFLAGADNQQWFEPLLNRLLAPLDASSPCGPPARHDPLVTGLRLLREEDDPSLPMGQWERPLKRADWAEIEQRCIALICERSKDLQTAVWLVEAWMRQRGFIGLCQGLRLLDALLRTYWDGLHPLIEEDGDCDARLAPLEWLNETLSTGILLHAALLTVEGYQPPQVSLADWDRLAAQDAPPDSGGAPTRADLLAAAGTLSGQVARTREAVQDSLGYVQAIGRFLQASLPEQAPSLVKLSNVLEAVDRVLLQVQSGQAQCASDAAPDEVMVTDYDDNTGAEAPATEPMVAMVRIQGSGWRDRNEAYATLDALADYLAGIEPHSPTPFLLRRAVRWGRMPLPEVLAEVLREEGDLNRLINVLGLQSH